MKYQAMPEQYRQQLLREVVNQNAYSPQKKDIIVIIHDQLEYVQGCLESVRRNTKDFSLHLYANGCNEATLNYLKSVPAHLLVSDTNEGFIKPNNVCIRNCQNSYIILLNSDTIVHPGWDEAMIGHLQTNPNCALVSYQGGLLNEAGIGIQKAWGDQIDYVSAWCMCLPYWVYTKFGLFDEVNLEFAYGEDADLSLRIKEAGLDIYALHLDYVEHAGSATIREVQKKIDTSESFQKNHAYLRERHKDYLKRFRE